MSSPPAKLSGGGGLILFKNCPKRLLLSLIRMRILSRVQIERGEIKIEDQSNQNCAYLTLFLFITKNGNRRGSISSKSFPFFPQCEKHSTNKSLVPDIGWVRNRKNRGPSLFSSSCSKRNVVPPRSSRRYDCSPLLRIILEFLEIKRVIRLHTRSRQIYGTTLSAESINCGCSTILLTYRPPLVRNIYKFGHELAMTSILKAKKIISRRMKSKGRGIRLSVLLFQNGSSEM